MIGFEYLEAFVECGKAMRLGIQGGVQEEPGHRHPRGHWEGGEYISQTTGLICW